MKRLEMRNGEVVDAEDATDPYYLRRDTHSVSGRGVYCPNEEVHYDPPAGLESGDECVACGEVLP